MKSIRLLLALTTTVISAPVSIDLSGEYQLHLASKGELLVPEDEADPAPGSLVFEDHMWLPGTTDLAGKGPHVTEAPPFHYHLNREFSHLGPAYFRRKITVPADWEGIEAELFLERVMWQSRVWIDGREVSSPRDSLSAPHVHRLGRMEPGEHELVIRVDNRMIHPIGDKGHGYGAQTQSIWNGIVGRFELRPVHRIERVRVFPSPDGTVRVEARGDLEGRTLSVSLDGEPQPLSSHAGTDTLVFQVAKPVPWSEFEPRTYQLTVTLADGAGNTLDTRHTSFGFREVSRDGTQLRINGRPAFLRGNLECAVFPKTGHPPVTVEEWKRIWRIYRAHNLNHARFHSWCPPEAAFTAADEMGIYLQVETPIWIDHWMTKPNPRPEMNTAGHPQGLGKGDRSIDAFARAELERILDAYGNHPSFLLFCFGNELGTSNFEATGSWIGEVKKADPRRLYAASTARTITADCDFNATHNIPNVGWCRQHVEFGTDWDYEKQYSAAPVPIIAHEIGQWPVYVDWQAELPKYTGPLKPYRLRNMAREARANGLYDRAAELRQASGASNRLLYRYEIESFLRTPSCRGFQLLGMQDFSGQGEALVGWLDSFYDSKGTTDPAGFRHYCAPVVPLLRLPSFVFRASDHPGIGALVRNNGPADLKDLEVSWKLVSRGGREIDSGTLPPAAAPARGVTVLGEFTPGFSSIRKSTQATLTLHVGGFSNRYDIWIHPDVIDTAPAEGLVVTDDWEDVAKPALAAGGTVVLSASTLGNDDGSTPASWRPLYWSVPFFPGQKTETIGLLVDSGHPAFSGFPSPPHGDWNWYRICDGARAFDVTGTGAPGFRGIAEPVSDFHFNRHLVSIFETRVHGGKLLVCGYDISEGRAAKLPETAALRRSLLDYAASAEFSPAEALELEELDKLFALPEPETTPLPGRFAHADLYVDAAARVRGRGRNLPWKKKSDNVLRKAKGVDYQVEADGTWRDASGSAWHGRKITVTVTPRPGVAGTFFVRFHDWNRNGRTGTVTFEGRSRRLGPHVDGEWLQFPVIREDTNDSRLVLTAEASSGPNLMITGIAFIPDE